MVDANCTQSSLFEEEQASGSTNTASPADLDNVTNNANTPSFKLLTDLVSTPISQLGIFEGDDKDCSQVCQHSTVPTFSSVLDLVKSNDVIDLDTKQNIAHEVIYSTILLKLLDENKVADKTDTG